MSRRSECSGPCGGLVANGMKKGCYHGYRFPPEVIHQAIWLHLRFTLSLRDVEDLLAQRGIGLSYESIRCWVNHFGPLVAADLRKRRPGRALHLASGRGLSEDRRPPGLPVARRRRRRRGCSAEYSIRAGVRGEIR